MIVITQPPSAAAARGRIAGALPSLPAPAPTAAASPATRPAVAGDEVRGPVPGYRYDVTLDPASRSLSGTGTITVTNTQEQPLDKVVLRLWANTPYLARKGGAASIDAVRVNGIATPAECDRTIVTIPLATPLATGQSATLDFSLNVTVPESMGRTGRAKDGTLYFGNALPLVAVRDSEGWNIDPYVVMGESFYNLAGDWKVRVSAPADTQLITTGSTAAARVADGRRIEEFSANDVRDFIVVAAKGYTELRQQVGNTIVRSWAPANDPRVAERMLKVAASSLDFYNGRYGEYRLPEYDVIATRGLGGGMEYPGLTLNDAGGPSETEIVAHETAHQWFYGIAGNNQHDEPFLDESMTSFLTAEYLRRTTDDVARALRPGFDVVRRRAAAAGITYPDHPATPPSEIRISSPMNVLVTGDYFGTIYGQGPRALANLKKEMGEERFLAGMRAHFEHNRNGIQSIAGFIETMSSAAGRDLTQWFAEHRINASEPLANDHSRDPNSSM